MINVDQLKKLSQELPDKYSKFQEIIKDKKTDFKNKKLTEELAIYASAIYNKEVCSGASGRSIDIAKQVVETLKGERSIQ